MEKFTVNNKKKASRFDDLIDAARSRQQRDNPQPIEDKSQSSTTRQPTTNRR